MSEEDKHKLSKILYYSDIHPADTEFINNIIYDLQQENKQLKEKIKHADEFCDRYMSVRLELFDMYELLNKIRKILGDEE